MFNLNPRIASLQKNKYARRDCFFADSTSARMYCIFDSSKKKNGKKKKFQNYNRCYNYYYAIREISFYLKKNHLY